LRPGAPGPEAAVADCRRAPCGARAERVSSGRVWQARAPMQQPFPPFQDPPQLSYGTVPRPAAAVFERR